MFTGVTAKSIKHRIAKLKGIADGRVTLSPKKPVNASEASAPRGTKRGVNGAKKWETSGEELDDDEFKLTPSKKTKIDGNEVKIEDEKD